MKTLYPLAYRHFTANELKPAGWLKRQLRIQAEGLSGHLDKMWPDVSRSAWIGGDKGGCIIGEGTPESIVKKGKGFTAKFLSSEL